MAGEVREERYSKVLKLASGGMATVWIGSARGALGFRQLVAIKRPHPHLLADPGFRSELLAEARLAAMIRHANVVDVRDVEVDDESINLVMDYIEGATLGDLLVSAASLNERLEPRVAIRIALDALAGLHAAHELLDERGRPVGLVHRDVSPQNILLGVDGMARVTDFGVAKFARPGGGQSTSQGSLKGKLAYMPPEYIRGEAIDRRFDIFAVGVVLWESLTCQRCFRGANEAETLDRVLKRDPESLEKAVAGVGPRVAAATARALAKNRETRFPTALEMATALEDAASAEGILGTHREVQASLTRLLGRAIEERRQLVRHKLKHEPSFVSLMSAPPMVPDPSQTQSAGAVDPITAAVSTERTPPPAFAASMGNADPTQSLARPPTGPSGSADPSLAATHAQASPLGYAPGPALTPATLRSDSGVAAAPPPSPETQLVFHESSLYGTSAPSRPAPRSRWMIPTLVGLVSAAATAAVLLIRPGAAPHVDPAAGAANAGAAETTASAKPPPQGPSPAPPPPVDLGDPPPPVPQAAPAPPEAPTARLKARAPKKRRVPAHKPRPAAKPEPTPPPPKAAPTATGGRKPPPNPF